MNPDVLRIMLELYTFTVSDLADELEMTEQGAGKIINHGIELKLLVRFRVLGEYVIALSERGERVARKLPALDPDERCLLLWRCDHADTIIRSWISNGDIVNTQHICQECGEVTAWEQRQNWFSGWVGASPDDRDVLQK